MNRPTEQPSPHRHLEKMSPAEVLRRINEEDRKVAAVVEAALPAISSLTTAVIECLRAGGRLFYIGSGTSGRLGVLDASECPPTYGVPPELVTGIIAGGDTALQQAVEAAEDDRQQGWLDLREHLLSPGDIVIGLSASGTTPYVVEALRECRANGITTGCITANPETPLAQVSDYPVEVVTGPELVTGSTRMKAGTAQKMVLNMISTTAMIGLGRVKDNRMIDMQLTNAKLVDRGTRMLQEALQISYGQAEKLLLRWGSVREAMRRGRDQ